MTTETQRLIEERVHVYQWCDDLNCATIQLKVLAEKYGLTLHPQVLDAATGMHGAGKYGVQCGMVEGGLMFIGILGKMHGFDKLDVETFCREYAREFEGRFGSLLCSVLRPEGFKPENPLHPCEGLICEGAAFAWTFMDELV